MTAGKRWAGEVRLPVGRPGERRQGFGAFTGPPRCLRTCGLHARQYPGRWAMAEYNLGVALHSQAAMAVAPDNTRLEFLTRAVAAFTATLDVYTPETAPADPPSSARRPLALSRGDRAVANGCALLGVHGFVLACSADQAPHAVGPDGPLRRYRSRVPQASPEHPLP